MDLKHYLYDVDKVKSIKQDVMEIRKLQVKHGIEVNLKDPLVSILFDDKYSEENLINPSASTTSKKRTQSLELPNITKSSISLE